MERPTYIDISANSSRAPSSAGTARTGGQPSPRIQHFDGDVPPVLSPLDAIAAESRRLAKELEATRIAGERRMSRLPPALISKSLSQHQANRPACFRSLSNHPTDPVPALPSRDEPFASGSNIEVNEPKQRPKSSYPRISAVSQDDEDEDEDDDDDDKQHTGLFETPREFAPTENPQDYFELRRTNSPPTLGDDFAESGTTRTASEQPHSLDVLTLIPPSAPFAKNRPYPESSDDDYTSSNAGSTFSRPRKLSNSSGMSYQVSPALHAQHERSPSAKSDISTASFSKSRQNLNFSRPMSSTSLNLRVDSPTKHSFNLERKPSHLSEETRNLNSFDDNRSVMSDGFLTGPGSSYTHKKFVLPRGKMSEKAAQRVSQLFAGLSGPTFGWQEPVLPGTPPLSARTDSGSFFPITSPKFRPSFDPGRPSFDPGSSSTPLNSPPINAGFAFGFESSDDIKEDRPSSSHTVPETDVPIVPVLQRPSTAYNASSFDRLKMPTLPTIPGSTVDDMSVISSNTKTERSASTVRPTTARSQSDYQALSADDHVDKAIQLHQHGDLKESTYHLRIAAKQDHPVGMLLYALACRHGWGMRANPTEAVKLLRRAVDIAMLEVTEDENNSSPRPQNANEKRSHEAQFALAIYELGMSHLKGWGVEVDKPLALRCFEIAGNWGDADALTEAGFCHSTGTGCKKDLKKAAKFYRMAADKGVSMVGNSWIYKEKYNDTNDTKDLRSRKMSAINEVKEKKPRDKSRTRSIFGRKRGNTISAEKNGSQPWPSGEA